MCASQKLIFKIGLHVWLKNHIKYEDGRYNFLAEDCKGRCDDVSEPALDVGS